MFSKLHLAGLVGLLTSTAGIVSSPEVAALIPGKWAAAITAAGVLIQAVTRAVHKGDVIEVPKSL